MDEKNVLVISSSPRRDGNSDLLCHEFAAAAREAGAEVEEIALLDLGMRDRGRVLGYGCGTPGMTRASRHLREAFELGASL